MYIYIYIFRPKVSSVKLNVTFCLLRFTKSTHLSLALYAVLQIIRSSRYIYTCTYIHNGQRLRIYPLIAKYFG